MCCCFCGFVFQNCGCNLSCSLRKKKKKKERKKEGKKKKKKRRRKTCDLMTCGMTSKEID